MREREMEWYEFLQAQHSKWKYAERQFHFDSNAISIRTEICWISTTIEMVKYNLWSPFPMVRVLHLQCAYHTKKIKIILIEMGVRVNSDQFEITVLRSGCF